MADITQDISQMRELLDWLMSNVTDGHDNVEGVVFYDSGCGCCSDQHVLPGHLRPLVEGWLSK